MVMLTPDPPSGGAVKRHTVGKDPIMRQILFQIDEELGSRGYQN